MPEFSDVVGIGLAGGQGIRARPLTLKAPGYLRSKAAMSFLGRRLIRWVIQILSSEGIKEYYVIAHGKENRYQIKVMIGYGEGFGVDVMYSPVKYDALSTGSADSTLRMLEYWDIGRTALVFPTDSIIDFDLQPMVEAHRRSGAVATIAAMTRPPDEVAEKYGMMLHRGGRVTDFVEKPTLAELREHFHIHSDEQFRDLPLMTNTSFYLIEAAVLRRLAKHPEVVEMRRTRLDFGKDLLPWLVRNGHVVTSFPVRRIGDLGNVRDFVDTTVEVLRGDFQAVDRLLGPPFDSDRNVWIAQETLAMRDTVSGKSLAEKIGEGTVTIGPAVRIGRFCEIGPGVTITESNLDDDVEVREKARISRSQIRDGAIVGAGARVHEAVVGSMTEVGSRLDATTEIADFVALGDEVTVHPGVHLAGNISVYPRLKIPAGIKVPPNTDVTGPADVLRYL
jgi:NDP-sugar pyrophosphorylase family protein